MRERTDHQLVSAVRAGDDRAFEELYSRYQRRIAAYVCGMVKDYGRAEDITQEVFVSALRRMRQTERPIAFKPWIYEIAKNACIDAYRRGRRAEEVSYDADDRLSPSDHVRLVATGPEPDAAVDAKLELDNLCGAFGGLSQSHHDILVLRELEGLSYKDIGERMGMSRPAVESTLFRARKRLGEEYDELASGRALPAGPGHHRPRRARRPARRPEARTPPLALPALPPARRRRGRRACRCRVRRRVAEKVAGLLPLPVFLRFRRGGDEAASAFGGGGGGWMAHAPSVRRRDELRLEQGRRGHRGAAARRGGRQHDRRARASATSAARATSEAAATAATARRRRRAQRGRRAVPGVVTLRARPAGKRDGRAAERRRGGEAGRSGAGARERGVGRRPRRRGPAARPRPATAQRRRPARATAAAAQARRRAGAAQAPAAERAAGPAIEPPQAPRIELPSVQETTEGVDRRAAGRQRAGPGRRAGRSRRSPTRPRSPLR